MSVSNNCIVVFDGKSSLAMLLMLFVSAQTIVG